jgi:hypothetical protein
MKRPLLNFSKFPSTLESTQTYILTSRVEDTSTSRVMDSTRNLLGLKGHILTNELGDSTVRLPLIIRKPSPTLSPASQSLETRFKRVDLGESPTLQKITDVRHKMHYFLKMKDAEGAVNGTHPPQFQSSSS